MIPNDDQLAIRDLARRFARERLAPHYQARETSGVLDRGLLREMGGLGLLGADLPEAFGGLGASGVTAGIIAEELAYGDFNISEVPVGVSLLGAIIMSSAAPAIAELWVPRMISGEALLGICLTEPSGGSDAANMMLRCHRDGDSYVLDGEKTSITFADCADAFIVFARTGSRESGAAGITAMIVDADTPGVARTRFNDVGSRITGRGSVFFEGVRVPVENRLGEENQGFTHVMRGFDYSRALIALECVGSAQASLDEAWEYTKTRTAFGAPIAQYQGVTFPLVEGETNIAAVRQLSYHALELRDAGKPHTAEAAMVKWLGPKTAFDVIHQCLLTFGHYGWSLDLPHQQRMRDVMGLEIGDGTAGIMKLIVARERIGRVAVQYAKR
ncbi:MAG: acyl-CoA dehydrogenase family protein [Roseiarcus sp.]|jgi:cyclohexanecarboxyl-CoA dehydrogenase